MMKTFLFTFCFLLTPFAFGDASVDGSVSLPVNLGNTGLRYTDLKLVQHFHSCRDGLFGGQKCDKFDYEYPAQGTINLRTFSVTEKKRVTRGIRGELKLVSTSEAAFPVNIEFRYEPSAIDLELYQNKNLNILQFEEYYKTWTKLPGFTKTCLENTELSGDRHLHCQVKLIFFTISPVGYTTATSYLQLDPTRSADKAALTINSDNSLSVHISNVVVLKGTNHLSAEMIYWRGALRNTGFTITADNPFFRPTNGTRECLYQDKAVALNLPAPPCQLINNGLGFFEQDNQNIVVRLNAKGYQVPYQYGNFFYNWLIGGN